MYIYYYYIYIYMWQAVCPLLRKNETVKTGKWYGHSESPLGNIHSNRRWLSHKVATFLQVNFPKMMLCVGSVRLALFKDFSIIRNVVSICATPS